MLLVRLRSEGKDGKVLAQMMYERFQENVEARVIREGVKVRLASLCLSRWCLAAYHELKWLRIPDLKRENSLENSGARACMV